MEKVPGKVVSVRLLFRGKLLVNSFIAKTVNSSTHVVLGEDFNENGSGRSTVSVSDFFNTDYRTVMVLIGLDGLLNVQLNSLHKQVNKDCWKFKFKDADSIKWAKFRDLFSAKLLLLGDMFFSAEVCGNVDAMWAMLQKTVLGFADEMFSRHWFSKFRHPKNRHSSKFFGLELLVAKIVKKFCSDGLSNVDLLVSKWLTLNNVKAHAFRDLVSSGVKSDVIVKHLSLVRKNYRRVKIISIKKTIDKRMKNFCSDKSSMIRSVLDRPFYKVVLDHLVVNDKLVLEPEEVKVNVDKIMEGMSELLSVISSLPNGKAADLSGIPNKLWKQDGVLTNTWPIALIETARKILSKVLSDRILVACSKFNILQGDNFLVLKSMSTQSLMFTVGSIVKDVLEKNREMCKKFIKFFGGIHENRVNRIITDFGLSGGYKVYDRLYQGERIFYDLLLYEVKRHEQLCEYRIDTKFVLKTGRIEDGGIENCQASTQYALNIASKFFIINDISINSEKTVAISINQSVKIAKLSICGQPILIAKKSETHYYLGIFLSTEELSKLSVARAYVNVHFFVNVVLKKAITDKQYSYLVLAVLQSIVSYHIQFSFVSSNVCHKWDALVRKSLRSKTCLFHDFPDAALHYSLLYGLKPFEQMQSEGKVIVLIIFSNASGVLRHLFSHRFLDLQFFIRLHVSSVNNFLAGLVKIFLDNGLSLVNNLPTAFCSSDYFSMSAILRKSLYFDLKLDLHGSVSHWFTVSSEFLRSKGFSSSGLADPVELFGSDILGSEKFSAVFMNGSLKNFGFTEVASSAATYFLVLDLSVGVAVWGLLLFTMAELQAVVLFLECIPSLCTVVLHLDSQAAIDAYVSKMFLAVSNFCNQCWIERRHIFNLVRDKNFNVNWVKVKDYSGVPENMKANLAAGAASGSLFSLSVGVYKHFLIAEGTLVSSNARYFVRDIFHSVCHAHWEAGPGFNVVLEMMIVCINWVVTFLALQTYLIKAVHRRLPVAVRKKLYNRHYPGVLCLLCGSSVLAGVSRSSASAVLQETCSVFDDKKVAVAWITDFVKFVVELHHVKVKMEKGGLVHDGSVISELAHGVSLVLFNSVVRLLDLAESFAVCFGCWRLYSFFSDLNGNVLVNIDV
ncbi:hypothetical protein G9A89_022787 [Geosiphon pyriformis]|nr:hypothetical protein G9A89_022787 [Geosiphon pyriformis]